MMRRFLLAGLLIASACSSGCYYSHLARGQLALLWSRQPLDEALDDPALPRETRSLLAWVGPVRSFAGDLGLRVGDQYTSYVDWPGDRVVTTVVRTRDGSLEPVPFWFPLVGRLPYKGYFDRERAEAEARRLRAESYDVCTTGVAAYSTLGWLDDPVTGPMLRHGPATLVETILHELVHATVFVREEASFNEGAALFVGQEATVRFFEARAFPPEGPDGLAIDAPTAERVRAAIDDRRAIARVILDFRDEVAALEGRPDRAAQRALAEASAREALAGLPLRVLDPAEVARSARLSDACLALRGTYARDLPRHARLLASLGGDLGALIERLARWRDEGRPVEEFFVVGDETRPLAQHPASRSASASPELALGEP